MLKYCAAVFLFLFLMTNCTKRLQDKMDYKLIWSDEFDYNGKPNDKKWSYDLGDGCPDNCNWGNNELQYYTNGGPSNARVENGHLIIEVQKENKGSKKYTSTRMITKNKGDWKYGRIEVKAKIPKGRGVWPAIWMLPTKWSYGGWPESGEIDIMENVGFNPDTVFATVHTKAFNHVIHTQDSKGFFSKTLASDFHIYKIEWNEQKIDFFFDNNLFQSFKNRGTGFEAWPFDQEFHIILNIAVGGNWGGQKGVDDTIFPQQMIVDYVRVYQK